MKRIALSLLCFISLSTQAQQDTAVKKIQSTPLPIILYNPFTGLGYGALVNVNFLLGNQQTTRFSNAQAYIVYTTHDQLAVQLNQTLFTEDEKWLVQGKAQYLNWPEYMYGLGGNTSANPPVKELISYKAWEIEERVMKRVGKKNFIGLQFRMYDCWNLKSDQKASESFFDTAAIGNKSFNSTGLGFHFVHDSRDNVQNAFTGQYLELAINPYFKAFGSTQDWTNLRVDARKYFFLNQQENHSKVMAFRLLYEQAIGDVPFMLMPMMGRYNANRAYVQGRYRGKIFYAGEAEYRAHIWRSLGYVAFAGLQGVDEPDGSFKYINPSIGAGLRVMLNKAQRTNLRVDYAMGTKDNSGLYLQVTEMF